MDSESFANMIKKKPVSNITPIPAPQPQKYDKISIYASLKYLGEQIGSVCESLKGIQISQDRSLADLQSVVSSLNTNASQNSEFELSEIQQTVNKMKSKLEELHSDVVKAVTVEKISNITPNKSQTGGEQSSLEDKEQRLEQIMLLVIHSVFSRDHVVQNYEYTLCRLFRVVHNIFHQLFTVCFVHVILWKLEVSPYCINLHCLREDENV